MKKTEEEKKAKLCLYIEAVDPRIDGDRGWVETNIELDHNDKPQKLSWRSGEWGSNISTLSMADQKKLKAKLMTLAEAMFAETEQREAWKRLLNDTFYEWVDEMFYRHRLEDADEYFKIKYGK